MSALVPVGAPDAEVAASVFALRMPSLKSSGCLKNLIVPSPILRGDKDKLDQKYADLMTQ